MQFYVIAPLLAIILARRKVDVRWVLAAAVALSLTSSVLHFPVPLLNYIVFFAIGMVAASSNWRVSGKLAIASLAGTVVILVACCASKWGGIILLGAHPGPLSIYVIPANVALAALMVPYALFTTGQKGIGADGMFADLSYIIYLLHWAATLWIGSHLGSVLHRLAYMAVAWTVVIALSLAIWKFYDHPINRLRSQWVSRRKRAAAVQVRPPELTREETMTS
jgi:peptidoglycan/LPS O-acetylase OafA/YrhL